LQGEDLKKAPLTPKAPASLLGDNEGSLNLGELFTSGEETELVGDHSTITQKKPYLIFENSNPFFRQWDQTIYGSSKFKEWTETRFFNFGQMQDCIVSEYSDKQWLLSLSDKKSLKRDLLKSLALDSTSAVSAV
jgi:hypothetical protein